MGPMGTRLARWMVGPLFRIFFMDIPESKYLFNIKQMIQEGRDFDYSGVSSKLLDRSWVPSYLKITRVEKAAA